MIEIPIPLEKPSATLPGSKLSEKLDAHSPSPYHMTRNPASGRILEKSGFKQEGLLRQRVRKWGHFEDVALWAILQQEWQDALNK